MTQANPLNARLEGPAPALEIAKDIAKRGTKWAPLACLVGGAIWGVDGAISTAYAIAVVVVNFLLSAWLLQATGRISVALMAGAALFGYILRLGLVFAAVMLVRDASWVSIPALGTALIVSHLGLLFWELKYVSGSFAYPGLKPTGGSEPPSAAARVVVEGNDAADTSHAPDLASARA